MSRSRCTLHISKLAEFTRWLEWRGWVEVPGKSVYEVLRMQRRVKVPGEGPLIVHRKDDATEHCTTWGESQKELRQWLRERKMGNQLKEYLGDGVYAEWREGTLILTTENGLSVLNTVYLEPDILSALTRFIDRVLPREH